MIEREVERNGKTGTTRYFYISSLPADAVILARSARDHWGFENRLYWVLNVVFHDGLARPRSGQGSESMAVVKHMAINLARNPKDKHSLKVRQNLANPNADSLEDLLRQDTAST